MLMKDRFHFPAAGTCAVFDAHPRTLLEELQAKILATAPRGTERDRFEWQSGAGASSPVEGSGRSLLRTAPGSRAIEQERSASEQKF